MKNLSNWFLTSVLVGLALVIPVLVAIYAPTVGPNHFREVRVSGEVDYRNGAWWSGSYRIPLDCPEEDSCLIQDIGESTWVYYP
jgi:hypothetical protein